MPFIFSSASAGGTSGKLSQFRHLDDHDGNCCFELGAAVGVGGACWALSMELV